LYFHNEKDLECLQPHHWLLRKPYCPRRCCCSWCSSFFIWVSSLCSCLFFFKLIENTQERCQYRKGVYDEWWFLLENKYEQFIIHKLHRHEVKSLALVHIIGKEEYALFNHLINHRNLLLHIEFINHYFKNKSIWEHL
jgi:hypothetical protein